MTGRSKMFSSRFITYLNIRLDAGEMDRRLRARISPGELFGVAFCFSMIGVFLWLINIHKGFPVDFLGYVKVEASTGLYYSAWIKPFFVLLELLPFNFAYITFCVINVLSVLFAVRVFGGNSLLVLASFQILSTLYYGNMSGILAGGTALCWWGLAHKRWHLAGLGMIIAMSKFQVGLFLCLVMIWYAAVSWREFSRIMVVPALVTTVSLIIYPLWLFNLTSNISAFPYTHLGITLWIYLGAWALLFWIPGLLIPMNRKERFFVILSLSTLTLPYYQHTDLLTLAAMPLGWLPLLLQVAFLRSLWGFTAIRLTALLPGLIYCAIVIPGAYRWVKGWMKGIARTRERQI